MTPPINIDGQTISDVTIDGQVVKTVTVDGDTVFGGGAIPDSVIWQVSADSYTTGDSTWKDEIGSNDISINGDPQSETLGDGQGVRGDGSDAYGSCALPTVETNAEFGFAYTFKTQDDGRRPLGRADGGTDSFRFNLGLDGADAGEIGLNLEDSNDNVTEAHADVTVNDGSIHYLILNKNGDDPSNWDFYIDDTATPAPKTITKNQGFDHTAINPLTDFYVWALNNAGSVQNQTDISFGVVEANNDPYTESEREKFVARRPEV